MFVWQHLYRVPPGAVMKLLALCVIFVTLQYVLSTNYISSFHNHDWICDYELDTANDIEVKTPKRSVEDKNKNNTNQITNGGKNGDASDKDDDFYKGSGPGAVLGAGCPNGVNGPGGACTTPDDKK
ncbi:unnamed protein product [Chrysodeixis includens]|uniref:Uncharacterized protein n=1 Tax=Chrysodeixis includens TaxID=689277 RepID=A0A9N8KVV1_CHRIL|nr:unnamed protein product [Chrysodeixis includens]